MVGMCAGLMAGPASTRLPLTLNTEVEIVLSLSHIPLLPHKSNVIGPCCGKTGKEIVRRGTVDLNGYLTHSMCYLKMILD